MQTNQIMLRQGCEILEFFQPSVNFPTFVDLAKAFDTIKLTWMSIGLKHQNA